MNIHEIYDRLINLGMQPWEVPTTCRPDGELEDLLTMHALRWAQKDSRVGIDMYPDGSGRFLVDEAPHNANQCSRKHGYSVASFHWRGAQMGGMLGALVEALEQCEAVKRMYA